MPTTESVYPESPSHSHMPTGLQELLGVLGPEVDRRNKQRVAAPYVFLLTPLEDQGNRQPGQETGSPITVVGKDLTDHGLGFYHEQPLVHRFVRLRLDAPNVGPVAIDVKLSRCRFTKLGWYESGGRVLRVSA